MKSILYLVTISMPLAASVNAQTPTPDAGSLNQLDRQPIQQSGGFYNPNSSSRQFFQQGKDNLYFLEESEPILQIEEKNEEAVEKRQEAGEDRIQESNETLEQAE